MKLRFKTQDYQTEAVQSVVDCFEGQPRMEGHGYHMDPGWDQNQACFDEEGFRNADLALTDVQILENVQNVQRNQNLSVSKRLDDFTTLNANEKRTSVTASDKRAILAATGVHLDIEMETGTGKTYCYIKTIFEMNKRYGWSKFIIMVPSVAIREGVCKSLEITAEHFTESYGRKARFFIYNSRRLHELESFSSDAGINVMVINIQAFNSSGKDNRRIYDVLDDFQSRKPIDVIAANRPILILDEPQKMEGQATLHALPKFKPLFILRYSATHRTRHNTVHRLDALDAYNRKLVKKISVCGIEVQGLSGSEAYMYLEGIEISDQTPVARIEMEIKSQSGKIRRRVKHLRRGDNLLHESKELKAYDGYMIEDINANSNIVDFSNGVQLNAGVATGDISEDHMRRIQIRETIRSHLDKEATLFDRGIKVLSLFFIDEVAKYRDYERNDTKGDYARIFEEEYNRLKEEYLSDITTDNEKYREYLEGIETGKTHNGYFSIDKKTNRMRDPEIVKRGANKGLSDDVDTYDLILKDKESLLSFDEPTRFIFSHSALREGWDNPNVFTMCMLKNSYNTISRRQEVGRGLRLSVDQSGERMDDNATVHDINVLTVVAGESYGKFVSELQIEISKALSARPRKANQEYFTGKVFKTSDGSVRVTPQMARQIYHYLIRKDYIDDDDNITDVYHDDKTADKLAKLPEDLKPYSDQIFNLIDSVFSKAALSRIVDDKHKKKTNPLNENFDKKEFKKLWSRINRKAIYNVDFESDELVEKCVGAIDDQLGVTSLHYSIQIGDQKNAVTHEGIESGEGFDDADSHTESVETVLSDTCYDLLGKVSKETHLTRNTVARILSEIKLEKFGMFQRNPEEFISQAAKLIEEQKATTIIQHLRYDMIDERYDTDIFTAAQIVDFSKATGKLEKHVFDHAIVDSKVERDFVERLDTSSDVTVYSKLPRGFLIPTPVGGYNPDWAIAFKKGKVCHIYFVAETKGSISSMALRRVEEIKIKSARKFFQKIAAEDDRKKKVRYDVVDGYDKLMELVNR